MGGGDATRRSTATRGQEVRARPAWPGGQRARGRVGYAAGIVWALACLFLYAWQLIGLAGG